MENTYEQKRLQIMENINDNCYLKIHPEESNDIFRCQNCEKIKLDNFNLVEYMNSIMYNKINQVSIDYNDNQPLYF